MCKKLTRTIFHAACSVYNCEELQKAYDEYFKLPSKTIYTATEIKSNVVNSHEMRHENNFICSYLGNLGLGRPESLCKIANELHNISNDYYLDIYGKIPNQNVLELFKQCSGIRYKGFVSYDRVKLIMQKSDLLVHAENFDPFYIRDLKYAFSTKIADSLASGCCFLLFAPEEFACTKYLKKYDSAFVVTKEEELGSTLKKIVTDESLRMRYIENAKKLAKKNHNIEVNKNKFHEILLGVFDKL